jgi:two-component system, cell cycle sensor histidine kinase and response regulator CckA
MSNSPQDLHQALSGTKEQYVLLFDNAPTPMWVFDNKTLRFLAVNKAALRLYGYSREEFLGMVITDIRPAQEVRRLLRHLSQLRRWQTANAGVWRHRRKDGSLLDREISVSRVAFHGRDGWLVSSREIDVRRNT